MNLYIDIDGTAVKSIHRWLEYVNPNFKPSDIKSWDFSEAGEFTSQYIEKIFADDKFYSKIEWFEDAKYFINLLSRKHKIFFFTKGTHINNSNKLKMIHENFPELSMITITGHGMMGKAEINMEDGLLLDDVMINLTSSNAKYKILFEPKNQIMNYNKDWKGSVVTNWTEFFNTVEGIERSDV